MRHRVARVASESEASREHAEELRIERGFYGHQFRTVVARLLDGSHTCAGARYGCHRTVIIRWVTTRSKKG